MSETNINWEPYNEDKDVRPKRVARPRVKRVTIYENYPLHQFYIISCLVFIALGGGFYGRVVDLPNLFYQIGFYQAIFSWLTALSLVVMDGNSAKDELYLESI